MIEPRRAHLDVERMRDRAYCVTGGSRPHIVDLGSDPVQVEREFSDHPGSASPWCPYFRSLCGPLLSMSLSGPLMRTASLEISARYHRSRFHPVEPSGCTYCRITSRTASLVPDGHPHNCTTSCPRSFAICSMNGGQSACSTCCVESDAISLSNRPRLPIGIHRRSSMGGEYTLSEAAWAIGLARRGADRSGEAHATSPARTRTPRRATR